MRGLLWFVSVVLLLGSTDGGSLDRMSYGDQPENIRAVIDKAIVKANEDYGSKHIDFYSVLANVHSKQMVQVLLTSTLCDKTDSVHRQDCKVSTDNRPVVYCVACGPENNVINCARFAEKKKIQDNIKKCPNGVTKHVTGGETILARKGNNEHDYGCLGCI